MTDDRRPRDRRREMELEAKRLDAAARGLDRYLEHRDNARFAIWRQAAIYVPSGVLLTSLLAVGIMNLPNAIVAVVVLMVFALPVDIEAIQAVRDLTKREPVTSRGVVDRQWAKGRFLFFGRVRYVLMDLRRVKDGKVDPGQKPKGSLFEVQELTDMQLSPGDQVEVVHWPHTNAIVSLELLSRDPESNRGTGSPDRPSAGWEELDRGSGTNMSPWGSH